MLRINSKTRQESTMLSRRPRGFIQTTIILLLLVCTSYILYLNNILHVKVKGMDIKLQRYQGEHQSLSSQLQAVYESRSKLENNFQKEKEEHQNTKDEVRQQKEAHESFIEDIRIAHKEKYQALIDEHADVKEQLLNSQQEFADLKQQKEYLEKQKNDGLLRASNFDNDNKEMQKQNIKLKEQYDALAEEHKKNVASNSDLNSKLQEAKVAVDQYDRLKTALKQAGTDVLDLKHPRFHEMDASNRLLLFSHIAGSPDVAKELERQRLAVKTDDGNRQAAFLRQKLMKEERDRKIAAMNVVGSEIGEAVTPRDSLQESLNKVAQQQPGNTFEQQQGGNIQQQQGDKIQQQPGNTFEQQQGGNIQQQQGDKIQQQTGDNIQQQPGETFQQQPGETFQHKPGETFQHKPGETFQQQLDGNIQQQPGETFQQQPGETFQQQLGGNIQKPNLAAVDVNGANENFSPNDNQKQDTERRVQPYENDHVESKVEGENLKENYNQNNPIDLQEAKARSEEEHAKEELGHLPNQNLPNKILNAQNDKIEENEQEAIAQLGEVHKHQQELAQAQAEDLAKFVALKKEKHLQKNGIYDKEEEEDDPEEPGELGEEEYDKNEEDDEPDNQMLQPPAAKVAGEQQKPVLDMPDAGINRPDGNDKQRLDGYNEQQEYEEDEKKGENFGADGNFDNYNEDGDRDPQHEADNRHDSAVGRAEQRGSKRDMM